MNIPNLDDIIYDSERDQEFAFMYTKMRDMVLANFQLNSPIVNRMDTVREEKDNMKREILRKLKENASTKP